MQPEQNDMLLSQDREIARVQSEHALLRLISRDLKHYFAFDDAFIFRCESDNSKFRCFTFHVEPARSEIEWVQSLPKVELVILDREIASGGPFVQYDALPFIGPDDLPMPFYDDALSECLTIKLYGENTPVGLLMLLSEERHILTEDQLDLLNSISYAISLALVNLMANEQVAATEGEKKLLLSLSSEIAAQKNRQDLFTVVNHKIRKLLAIEEFCFSKLDEDGKYFSAFVMDFDSALSTDPNYERIRSTKYSIDDPLYAEVMSSHDPVLYYVDELTTRPNMPDYVHYWKSAGKHAVIIAALRVGGVAIGTAVFIVPEGFQIDTKNILLKALCSQLAVAVSNILANEKIEKRDQEKELLLTLSNEIAALKSREDLFKVVNGKVRELFKIQDFGFSKIDEGGETFSAFIMDVAEKFQHHPDYDKTIATRFSVRDPLFTEVMSSEDPVIYVIDELITRPDMPPYVFFWKSSGIQRVLISALRVGGAVIGTAIFILEPESEVDVRSVLLKGVSSQLAVAISNILANEEIERRTQEKNILLSLSGEIAALRTREDMFLIVNNRIKQLLSVEEFGILEIEDDGKTISPFAMQFSDRVQQLPDYRSVSQHRYSIDSPLFKRIFASEEPVLLDVAELADRTDSPATIHFWKEAGFKYFLAVPLHVAGKLMGCVTIHFIDRATAASRLTLVKGICAQLAVGMSNILATEKILTRQKEKNLLLSFSTEIAAVKSREDLFRVMNEKIKKFFSVKQLGFSKIDEDRQTYSVFLIDVEERIRQREDLNKIVQSRFDINDPVISLAINSPNPVLLDVRELVGKAGMPPYVSFWAENGIEKVVIAALRVGGSEVGAVVFVVENDFDLDPESTLLKGVCSQLAVSISNIISNEKIQEREVEKTKLLEFSNAIASVRDKGILGKILKRQLCELFGIEDYVIHALSPDKKTHRPILFDPDSDFVSQPDFARLLEVDTDVNDGVFNSILSAGDLVEFNIEEWFNSASPPTYSRAARAVGLKNMLGITIRMGDENIGVMNFRREGINDVAIQRPLFKSICSQIAITLSNLIANDKVVKQLAEIERYKQQLEEEKVYLKEELEINQNYSEIIGESSGIKKVFRLITQVAASDSTVLLLGETGTGKELIARAIHNASPRKDKLMVKINCAALPANLIESELFGHERGSFTGAIERRIGKFELANKGTLFLDEVGEMPLELQVKLLRAIQEKEVERIGGKTTIKTDVRIIAATNRDLEKLMEEGKFRPDLYYRLNIFPIHVPSLRERRDDIPLLAQYFINRFSKKAGRKITTLNARVLEELKNYDWPGNIREMEHIIERSILLATGETVREIHLPDSRRKHAARLDEDAFKLQTLSENEKEYILRVLKHVNGRISGEGGAADLLGIPPSTLNSRIKKLGIKRTHQG